MTNSLKKQLEAVEKRLKDLEDYVYNMDDFLPARSLLEKAIGYIEKKDSVTEYELVKRFRIPLVRAQKLFELFLDYGFVTRKEDLSYRVIPEAFNKYTPPPPLFGDPDTLFEEAVKIVNEYEKASASLLQRRLKIGYARAAAILDQLEAKGVVGSAEGVQPRIVLKNK